MTGEQEGQERDERTASRELWSDWEKAKVEQWLVETAEQDQLRETKVKLNPGRVLRPVSYPAYRYNKWRTTLLLLAFIFSCQRY